MANSPDPNLILFAAKWCGYCAQFLSMARGFSSEFDVELHLVNADDPDESLWDEYGLKLVPTLVIFQSGKQLFRKDGRPGAGLKSADLVDALNFLTKSG